MVSVCTGYRNESRRFSPAAARSGREELSWLGSESPNGHKPNDGPVEQTATGQNGMGVKTVYGIAVLCNEAPIHEVIMVHGAERYAGVVVYWEVLLASAEACPSKLEVT